MGTLIGHLVPGLAFTLLGLWQALNTIKAYKLKSPSSTFTSSTWFPFSKIRHLELYLILAFSFIAVAFQFVDGLSLSPADLEHATIFLHLAIYAATALAVDHSAHAEAFGCLVGGLAASGFSQELFLLDFHSTDHVGLEGHYHWLMQLLVGASAVATVAAVGLPTSFAAVMVRSAAVMGQGIWFWVMGLVLWGPSLVPEGCYAAGVVGGKGAVECRTEKAGRRAVALANLQFSWMIAGILVLMVYLCLRLDCKCMEYRQLESKGTDGVRREGEGEGGKQVSSFPV